MQKSRFAEWSKLDLERTFGLNQADSLPALSEWIDSSNAIPITDMERQLIQGYQASLIYRGDDWNEVELTAHFIAPIMALVNFNTRLFGLFAERTIQAVVDDYELSGEPDAIIAKGRRAPEIPYFCFHEYKRENEPKGDPAGQALVAMLVAQELNGHHAPIYGLYVSGKQWYFLILHERGYAISQSFSADRDEVFDIVKMLKRLKQMIERMAQAPNP